VICSISINERYRAAVPVTTGTNTLTVTATDQDEDVTTSQWQINVPTVQPSFPYDANGNMLTDSNGRVFTWDGKNRLKTVTVAGTTYEWDYDYRDRRVREYVYASGGSKPTIPSKQFVWHGNDIVQERVGTSATAGTISRNHYYGGFTIGATVSTAAKYQTFTDHLGHVREVVAASGTNPAIGTVLTRYEYSPYQGPTKVYQFPGTNVEATFQTIGRYYHHEASGLELALYRAYDPELGRWISEDPLGEAELIEGPNLYRFGANRPIDSIDPEGTFVWFLLVAVFGSATTAWAPGMDDDTSEPAPAMLNPVDVACLGRVGVGVTSSAIRFGGRILPRSPVTGRIHNGGYLRPYSRPHPIGGRYEYNTMKAAREAAERASPLGKAVKHCGPKAGGHRDHYHPAIRVKPNGEFETSHDHYFY
jgi:RHS repeat-associated protein